MNLKVILASSLVFIACLSIGFWIAQQKYLWNDECYTAVSSVDGQSYISQLSGHIPEGSNAPLFYLLQKSFCQVIGYQIPVAWKEGHWDDNAQARIMLRVIPVVCMSLSIALVFLYFAYAYSFWTALYSLLIYVSSYMLWIYWAEARPYSVIVLVTTIQSLLFLHIVSRKEEGNKEWIALAAAHVFLSLTFIFSLGLIWAASVIIWFKRRWDKKRFLLIAVLPTAVALYYYAQAPRYPFYFDLTPEQLIRDNVSRERFYILLIFAVFLLASWLGTRIKWLRYPVNQELNKAGAYFFFTLLALSAAFAVLGLFMLNPSPPGEGFPITSRYFIYLMPVGVIASVLMTRAVIQSLFAYWWLQLVIAGLIGYLVVHRFLKVVPKAVYSIMGSGS